MSNTIDTDFIAFLDEVETITDSGWTESPEILDKLIEYYDAGWQADVAVDKIVNWLRDCDD